MKRDSNNKTEKFWDRSAGTYDREEQKHKSTYQLIIEKLKGYLQPTDIVLDFGCGTGLIANEISKSAKEIHGIDISSKMIALAKAKAEARQLNNVTYTHTTIDHSSLKADSFDVVLAFHILHLVEDTSIRRIKELLKSGGILISVTPCMANNPLYSRFLALFGRIGLVPKISSFRPQQLERLLTDESLTIIENMKLAGTSNQYFIVGKK